MAISSGYLNKRVVILKLTKTQDDTGQLIQEYTLVQMPWTRVITKTDVEASASRVTNNATMTFIMRYSKSLENPNSTLYLGFKKQIYDIVSVINVNELNERMEVTAVRRTNETFDPSAFRPSR